MGARGLGTLHSEPGFASCDALYVMGARGLGTLHSEPGFASCDALHVMGARGRGTIKITLLKDIAEGTGLGITA